MVWKKIWPVVLLVCAAALPAAATGQAEVVYDVWSRSFLYEKQADCPMKVASTTKLLTALVAAEQLEMDEVVEIAREHTLVEGSRMYLCAGEKRTVKELLCGLLLASGNDAALALADAAGGQAVFAEKMNQKAAALGCTDCHFENPTGLDGEDHHATARAMALIAAEALSQPELSEIMAMRHAAFDGHELRNHNKLLWKSEACIGGKTGFTRAAGRCLVSIFEKDGRPLIIVSLHDADDWQNHLTLYETYTADLQMTEVRLEAALPVVNGAAAQLPLAAVFSLPLRAGESHAVTAALYAPHFLYALPPENAAVGEFVLFLQGYPVYRMEAKQKPA